MPSGRRVPPGPSPLAKPWILAQLVRNPFRLLSRCVARYGDVYRLPLGPGGISVFNDPEHVQHWLSDAKRYEKGEFSRRAVLDALGDGIPISRGDKWRRNRKLMNPIFGRRSISALAPVVSRSLDDSLLRWDLLAERGEVVDVYRELGIMTMQVLQRALFSSSVGDERVPELVDHFRQVTLYMGGLAATYSAPRWFPVPGARRGVPARRALLGVIDQVVARRRAEPIDTPDLLNLLLAARHDDTGEPLSDDELRDELMGLWFGGFDTTASALLWTLAMLALHREPLEQLRAEADAYTGDFDSEAALREMEYARACFDEAQRIQGAVLLTREAQEDDEIAGFAISAGSQVGLSSYTMNRHPAYWDGDPERYDPERFLGERRKKQHRFQFVMFGGGPHRCIGESLAYLEGCFALHKILRRFEIRPRPGFRPVHHFHLSIGIKGGLPASVHRREV